MRIDFIYYLNISNIFMSCKLRKSGVKLFNKILNMVNKCKFRITC